MHQRRAECASTPTFFETDASVSKIHHIDDNNDNINLIQQKQIYIRDESECSAF